MISDDAGDYDPDSDEEFFEQLKQWSPTEELRFVRRKVQFDGNAEPAFRLVLQQCWWRINDAGEGEREWRDIPTVAEE